jgi:hypothetical protein
MKRDLHETILRNSVARVHSDRNGCSSCERIPLTGEVMYESSDGEHLCSLCLKGVPESQRDSMRAERVHVGSIRLAVRAAA